MDSLWFQEALERSGATQADLARHLRLAPSAVSRMLRGERQMKLLEAVQIADFLGVKQEEVLRHAGGGPPTGSESIASGPVRSEAPLRQVHARGRPPMEPRAQRGSDLMPIKSAARGGGEQEMFLEDGPIGYTPRPANLSNVREAYALYMVGDSMEPRYEAGWLLHVNPFKPPVRGRDVVVYKTNQAVLIKQFVGWEGETLVLRQLNPPQLLRFPKGELRECHLIVGSDQEG